MRRWALVSVFVWLVACSGDDSAADASTGTEHETEATGSTSTEGGDTTSETGETGELGELMPLEPEIIHHPGQPMILDLIATLDAPGTGELVHESDAGAQIAQLSPGPGQSSTTLHFRVRGLLPGAEQSLSLSVSETDGPRTDDWSGVALTDEALPGFLPKFEIETADAEAVDSSWRLFDMTELFSTAPSGVFFVDDEGTTRWYLGDVDDYTDLDDVFTGLAVRPDGTLSFLRRDAAWVVDELGVARMHVDAESLGAEAGLHHDLTELPNGNFLALSYSFADVDYQDEGTLHVAGDLIYEFTTEGEVEWVWNAFDHLDPQRRRDGFFIQMMIPDPNSDEDGHDWTHGNGLVYDEATDTILLSMRHQDWIVAIDHPSGEILWRLGEEGDFSLVDGDRWFFHQHSPQWQPDGSLLLYDNAVGDPMQPVGAAHSRAIRYVLDFDAMTATQVWADDDPLFRSPLAGDADRMISGHVLRLDSVWIEDGMATGRGRLRELDPERSPNAVWSLVTPPQKFSYRAVPLTRFIGVAD